MIFKDQSAAVKSKAEEFNADISPSQLLTKMFQDETKYKFDHFIRGVEDSDSSPVARRYSEMRHELVQRIFQMGKKFEQRQKTLHIGVELMDRYFLDPRTQSSTKQISTREQNIVMSTCFLIASKYDEIDDHLVFINDV